LVSALRCRENSAALCRRLVPRHSDYPASPELSRSSSIRNPAHPGLAQNQPVIITVPRYSATRRSALVDWPMIASCHQRRHRGRHSPLHRHRPRQDLRRSRKITGPPWSSPPMAEIPKTLRLGRKDRAQGIPIKRGQRVIAGKAISVALNAHHARGEKAAADRPIWSVSTVVAITQIE
jgi:hypothetical protein